MVERTERTPRITGVFSARGLMLAALLVVLLAAAGGEVVRWFYGLPPEIDGPAFYNRLTAEASGDLPFDSPDNAVVHYRTLVIDVLGLPGALEWYAARSDDPRKRRWRELWTGRTTLSNLTLGRWDDPRQADGRAMLADLRPIFEQFDVAADAPWFRPRYSASNDIFNPDDSDGPIGPVEMRVPHMGLLHAIHRLNVAQIRASAHTNDWTDVVRRVRTGLRNTRHLANEPLPWAPRWGAGMDSTTLAEVRHLINEHELPLSVCDGLIREIEEAGPIRDLATALGVERITFTSLVRDEFFEQTGSVVSVSFWRTLLNNPPPRLALRDAEQFFDQMEDYLALPYAQRSSLPIPNLGAAGWFLPSFSRIIDQLDAAVAQRAATLALLRLERFHAMNGRWPATLEEAMTREQTLEPVTGAPFIYLVGSDGLRPVVASDEAAPYLPSDLALARTKNMTFEREEELAGPGWPFTLLAPVEAMFMRDPEFTTRRGVIYRPPEPNALLR
jgi:hypothetical protein